MPLLWKSRASSQGLQDTRKKDTPDARQTNHHRTGRKSTVGKRRRPSVRGGREGPRPVCGRPSSTTESLRTTNFFNSLNPEIPYTSVYNVSMSDQAESIELPCLLKSKNQRIPSSVTIDCGANGSLINPKFAQRNQLPTTQRKFPAQAILADGKQVQEIDQTVTTKMTIGPHKESITLDVMKLGNTSILLGNG